MSLDTPINEDALADLTGDAEITTKEGQISEVVRLTVGQPGEEGLDQETADILNNLSDFDVKMEGVRKDSDEALSVNEVVKELFVRETISGDTIELFKNSFSKMYDRLDKREFTSTPSSVMLDETREIAKEEQEGIKTRLAEHAEYIASVTPMIATLRNLVVTRLEEKTLPKLAALTDRAHQENPIITSSKAFFFARTDLIRPDGEEPYNPVKDLRLACLYDNDFGKNYNIVIDDMISPNDVRRLREVFSSRTFRVLQERSGRPTEIADALHNLYHGDTAGTDGRSYNILDIYGVFTSSVFLIFGQSSLQYVKEGLTVREDIKPEELTDPEVLSATALELSNFHERLVYLLTFCQLMEMLCYRAEIVMEGFMKIHRTYG